MIAQRIRSIYHRVIPFPVTDFVYQRRRSVRRGRKQVRGAYLRLRYGDRRRYMRKPDSHPDRIWEIDTNAHHSMRGAWLRDVVRGSVLDVGCGHGYATCDIASTAEHVHAVDISEELLGKAADLVRLNSVHNVTFSHGDAYSLQFDDQAFDTVTLLEILEHLERPQDAVSEALRVARERVVVTVPAYGHMTDVDGHIQDFRVEDLRGFFPGEVRVVIRKPFTFVLYECGSSDDS